MDPPPSKLSPEAKENMPEIESDKEGNATHADDDKQPWTLAGQLGPGMTEKNNLIRKIIASSKNQNTVIRSLITRIVPEAEKHPMDMTLDELYRAYLRSIRKGNLKPGDKETEETEETKNCNRLQEEQISKNIDRATEMLKALNLCVKCNVRIRANQWAKYCHAPCTPDRRIEKDYSSPMLGAPPTVQEMIFMLDEKQTAEE